MSPSEQAIKLAREEYSRAHEALVDILVDALCATYNNVTHKEVSDRLREKLFDAVRFDV